MWGRTPTRHMISPEKNPPTDWDVESGKNVKWKASVGSKSYGNPVIANGLVFVGTNNEAFYAFHTGGMNALLGDGSLELKWKCANPAGSQGTMYQVSRRIGASGPLVQIGGSGTRDTAMPPVSTSDLRFHPN